MSPQSETQVDTGTVGAALEREHREIDAGIEEFSSTPPDGADAPTDGQRQALTRAADALRRHIYLEEQFLFPAMRAEFAIPMGVMLREHGEIWRTLDALQAKLNETGDHAQALEICQQLLFQLDKHNTKEEPIFYTQADTKLSAEESEELTDFIKLGQMPQGWVCQTAGE